MFSVWDRERDKEKEKEKEIGDCRLRSLGNQRL